MYRSAPKLFCLFIVFAVQWSFSTEGHTSKFTHPERAYVSVSEVTIIRTQRELKRALPRKSQYQWVEPTIDGQSTCGFLGKVTKLEGVVDSWQMVDLSKTLVGGLVLATGPCVTTIGKGGMQAEITFSPKYNSKTKRMIGTVARAKVVELEHLLRLGPTKDLDVNGYRFCLRNTQSAVYGTNAKPKLSSFEVRWVKLPATKASKFQTLFFKVNGKAMASQSSKRELFQESGPFATFLQDFEADGSTLKFAEIRVFQKYD